MHLYRRSLAHGTKVGGDDIRDATNTQYRKERARVLAIAGYFFAGHDVGRPRRTCACRYLATGRGFHASRVTAAGEVTAWTRTAESVKVVVSWSEPYLNKAGQDLADIASCWCCAPEEAARRLSPGGGIYYKIQEDDVRRIVAHPRSMIGSDGLLMTLVRIPDFGGLSPYSRPVRTRAQVAHIAAGSS